MRLIRYICIALSVITISLVAAPANAGVGELISRAAAWWNEKSVTEDEDASAETSPVETSDEVEDSSAEISGMCRVPQQPPVTVCELGAGFLCVNTPPGSVDTDRLRIQGTIDRYNSVVASIRVAVQNEYTKNTKYIRAKVQAGQDCWGNSKDDEGFCLDGDGRFSISVPLEDLGPYTITISASRLSGGSVVKSVRTSRVVPLELASEDVAFDPDVTESEAVDSGMVTVTVKLMGDCSFCDFIGASTGGVTVSVENAIVGDDGSQRRISCDSSVEQGGQGQFAIGVPTFPGKNTLTVRACNAATEGACPSIGGISFDGGGGVSEFDIVSPPAAPAYESDEYPTIPFAFTLGGGAGCAQMQFNRAAPTRICADESGRYSTQLSPDVGINVVTVSPEGGADEFAWTFGWGQIESPFANEGSMEVAGAAGVTLSASTVKDILVPLVNNILASDELGSIFSLFSGGSDDADEDDEGPSKDTPRIPGCGSGGSLGELKIGLRGDPEVGSAVIEEPVFGNDRVDIQAVLKDTTLGIDLILDEDEDGVADKDPLPLVISFRKAIIDLALAVEKDDEGRPLLLITSPHEDCDFKAGRYCKGTPAALIPQNLVGGATPWGGFVRCDDSLAKGEATDACKAMNSLNAQTGVVSTKVLDAINGALYCGGSKVLSGMMQDFVTLPEIRFGCASAGGCEDSLQRILPEVAIPWGLRIEDGRNLISSGGLKVAAAIVVGDDETYEDTPSSTKIPQAGLITDTDSGDVSKVLSSSERDIGVGLKLDALNALLFAAVAQGDGRNSHGLLDFDIDQFLFEDMGFDFVKECDQFVPVPGVQEEPPTLCHIRPRVGELLGSSLTTYGYFSPKHPLMLSVRGNRALTPILRVAELSEMPVVVRTENDNPAMDAADSEYVPTGGLLDIRLGGVTLAFYALEVDEDAPTDDYGNLKPVLDEDGEPLIQTMRPDDPDPLNGPIVTFDVSLLLGVEIGDVEIDPMDDTQFIATIRTLADRSRLVITQLPGSNATTVPARGLISSLTEKLNLAIAGMSSDEGAVKIPVPKKFVLASEEGEGLFGLLGLRTLELTDDGVALDFDRKNNSVSLALDAIIHQVLHRDSEEVNFTLPQ